MVDQRLALDRPQSVWPAYPQVGSLAPSLAYGMLKYAMTPLLEIKLEIELEIKDTTESFHSASYLDLYLEIDKNRNLCARLYDKCDDFDFPIVNFPFLDSNIPASPAYGVFISQLIRYARACTTYKDFLSRGSLLTVRLLQQGYQHSRLKACLKKFYGCYQRESRMLY